MIKRFIALILGTLVCLSLAHAGMVGSRRVLLSGKPQSNVPSSCPTSLATIARMPQVPSAQLTNTYNGIICPLVASGTWAKLNFVHWLASDTSGNAMVNLVSSSFPLTLTGTGTCTFMAKYAYPCDGTAEYFDTGFTPSINGGGLFTLNSASYGAFVVGGRTTGLDAALIGTSVTTGTTDFDYIIPKFNTDSHAYGSINQGTSNVNALNSGSVNGVWIINTLAGVMTLYQSGSSFASVSMASQGLANQTVLVSARRNLGAVASFSSDPIVADFAGSGLTPADISLISSIFLQYTPTPPSTCSNTFDFSQSCNSQYLGFM